MTIDSSRLVFGLTIKFFYISLDTVKRNYLGNSQRFDGRVARTNQPLLDEMTDQQRKAVLDGADAISTLTDFRRRSFDLWMAVARGVAVLCKVADRPGMSRNARKNLLKDNGYGTLNEGTVSRLCRMAENETAIRVWRDSLTENKREAWNSQTSVCARCPVVRKAIAEANKDKPKRERRTNDQHKAFENLLDKIEDVLHATEDADHRASFVERLLATAAKHSGGEPAPVSPTPKGKKGKGKTKPGFADEELGSPQKGGTPRLHWSGWKRPAPLPPPPPVSAASTSSHSTRNSITARMPRRGSCLRRNERGLCSG